MPRRGVAPTFQGLVREAQRGFLRTRCRVWRVEWSVVVSPSRCTCERSVVESWSLEFVGSVALKRADAGTAKPATTTRRYIFRWHDEDEHAAVRLVHVTCHPSCLGSQHRRLTDTVTSLSYCEPKTERHSSLFPVFSAGGACRACLSQTSCPQRPSSGAHAHTESLPGQTRS